MLSARPARELPAPTQLDRALTRAISAGHRSPHRSVGMTLYERGVRLGLKTYKATLSPLIGQRCRYLPTCSEYAAQALVTHGPVRGSYLAARRVCRCHPWGGSGYDPVPPRKCEPL